MKKINCMDNSIKKLWKDRAAIVITIAVSVFLCALTIFEFTALRREWNIPVLNYITGGADSYLFKEYRNEEMTLDDSTENVILEQPVLESTQTDEVVSTEQDTETEAVDEKEDTAGNSEGEAAVEEAEFPYYIKVNRNQNCITVYRLDENGAYTIPYKAIICSTGLYNATPLGTFHLSTKYLWRALYGGVYGQYATRITGGVLFHSVPYYRKSKSALCTDKYNKLGQQASMGCIRLTVEDAKWIADNCPSGTTVEIYDDEDLGPLGKPEADKIDTDSPSKGWDPTDPDIENPWNKISEDQ